MRASWTHEENKILADNFSSMSDQEIQTLIPSHSIKSIQTQARRLDLKKTKEYRHAYLTENRKKAIEALKGNTPWNKQVPIHKICETCGKPFDVPPNRKDTARYCSRACVDKWLTTTKGENHWHYRLVDRTCQWCSKTFKCKPAKVTYGEGLFCSRQCQGSYTTYKLSNGHRSSIEITVEENLIALNEPFEPQKQVGPWLVDFYLPTRNLVIECDGEYWHNLPEVVKRDRRKDYWLRKNGYNLLRLSENAIKVNARDALMQGLHTNTSLIKDL